MKIIVCGAGEVGKHAAEALNAAGNSVTVIDLVGEKLRAIGETMDVQTLEGNAASAEILRESGADKADLVITSTDKDEVNLLAGSIAKGLGAKRVVARVDNADYFEQRGLDYEAHLGIDLLISPEYSTAQAMARTLRNPGALAIEEFARGQIEMLEFTAAAKAPGVGRRLADAQLPAGARLAAIRRDGKAFLPEATSVVVEGDTVVLVANAEVFQQGRKLYQESSPGRRKLVVMGGPSMAVTLCESLKDRGFSIRLFETDRTRAEQLAERLDFVTVIHGDPTDRSMFEEEHIDQADAFIGLDDDDERNILGCAWAKSMGVALAMAVVQKPNYLHLLTFVGIDRPYSPRLVAVKEIQNLLDMAPLRQLASLAEGSIDVYRIRIDEQNATVGRAVRDLSLTPEWIIVAVQHGRDVKVPSADDVLHAGDLVLVVGQHGKESKLKRVFGLV